MKNFILILIIITSFSADAQWDGSSDICEDLDMTTDPQSPVDLRGQPYINLIDGTNDPKFD